MPMSSTSGAFVSSSASTIATEEVAGSHVLTIDGYTRSKQLATGECLRSSTFLAAGHRWSIKYFPNGRIDGDWITTDLQLDDSACGAPGVVKARFTFSLLDLNGEPVPFYTHHRPMYAFGKDTSKGIGLIKRKALEQSSFLCNDSFRIRCDITVLKVIRKRDAATNAAEKFVIVPPLDMDRHLGHLLSTGEGADITLEVDGETFPAHRNILAARSPVFRTQLFGPMKEDSTVCMWIDGIEARVFKAFLHFVYTDYLPEIEESETMAMVQHLLVAADRYSVQRLKLMCEDELCNYIDTNSVGTILALAEQHGCDGLKKASLEFLMFGSNLKAAIETDGFDHLSKSCPSVLKELLAKVAL